MLCTNERGHLAVFESLFIILGRYLRKISSVTQTMRSFSVATIRILEIVEVLHVIVINIDHGLRFNSITKELEASPSVKLRIPS